MQQPSSFSDDEDEQRNDCFRRFDRRSVGAWDEDDCRRFVQQSLLVGSNIRASAAEALAREVFARFSERDGRIDAAAFERLWSRLVRPLLRPRAALVVVDVQNDFIEGSLAIGKCPARQEGSEVIPVINAMVRDVPFAVVAYSMDWHPPDHISFHDNLHLYELHEDHRTKKKDDIAVFDSVRFAGASLDQILWPKHCVQGSWGARLHEELVVKKEGGAVVVKKGQERTVDSYSAFFDNARRGRTELEEELKQRGVSHLIVCGVALDFCVGYTCLDSLTLGFPTVLVRDAARGTDEKGISEMVAEIRSRHGVMADAKEVRNIVEGKDIREEFVRVLLAKESSA